MVAIAAGGLVINLVGLAFFQEAEGDDTNIYGLFLHVLADLLGSVSTLVSCYLVKYHKIQLADPICALIKSIMIFLSVLPLLKLSCESLLLQAPSSILNQLTLIKSTLTNINGVHSISKLQCCQLSQSNSIVIL